MGHSIFNMILSDVNGIPSLPIFIGNYLLDLLSTFFPLFILLSSFVMVYIGLTKGSGDWKQTAQQVAPTAVSLFVIMSLLSMKTSNDHLVNSKNDFFKDTNSYTVVEMMSTFLSFGNVFADALTHKVIYGSVKVNNNEVNDYNGYFPAVLQAMVDGYKDDKSEIKNNLESGEGKSNKEILDMIRSNNASIAGNTNNLIDKLHNLGITRDFRRVTEDDLKEHGDRKFITSDGSGYLVLNYYDRPQRIHELVADVSELNNLEVTSKPLGKPDDETTSYYGRDFIEKANGGLSDDKFLLYPEKAYYEYYKSSLGNKKEDKNVSPQRSVDMEKTFAYMSISNFDVEGDMIKNTKLMLSNYLNTLEELTKLGIQQSTNIQKAKKLDEKTLLQKELNSTNSQIGYLAAYIKDLSIYYNDYINTVNDISSMFNLGNKATIDQELVKKINASLSGRGNDNFFESLPKSQVITPDVLADLKNKAKRMRPNDGIEFLGLGNAKIVVNNVRNTEMIKNTLNKRMETKSYITNVFYDKFLEQMRNDSLFQEKMGFNQDAPYNRLYLSANKYNSIAFIENKINNTIRDVKREPVKDTLAKEIKKQYGYNEFGQGELIHWTDLGKYYATFKNLYSPMLTKIVNFNAYNELSVEKAATLAQGMEELESGAKSSRLLNVAHTMAGGALAVELGKTLVTRGMNKKINMDKLKGKDDSGSMTSIWNVIKMVGGVYFAILFINVVLPAFIWMFVIITYYVEMAIYVAVFPIGFMFMIFQSYRQSLHQYINMLLGFILMPIILVSMYFVVLYIDMSLPVIFKQFLPFFGTGNEMGNAFSTAFGSASSPLHDALGSMYESGKDIVNNFPGVSDGLSSMGGKIMSGIGNMIYTILSMLMSVLLLLTFFRANEYMSKILNVSTVGMDSFQGKETLNKFGNYDKSGVTSGVVGR